MNDRMTTKVVKTRPRVGAASPIIYCLGIKYAMLHPCTDVVRRGLTLAFTKGQDPQRILNLCQAYMALGGARLAIQVELKAASYVLVAKKILPHRQQTDVIYLNRLTPRLYKFGKG